MTSPCRELVRHDGVENHHNLNIHVNSIVAREVHPGNRDLLGGTADPESIRHELAGDHRRVQMAQAPFTTTDVEPRQHCDGPAAAPTHPGPGPPTPTTNFECPPSPASTCSRPTTTTVEARRPSNFLDTPL